MRDRGSHERQRTAGVVFSEEISRRARGRRGEEEAVRFLEEKGLRILERNFHDRDGEIDIIALEKDVLLFIEVKYRTSRRFGNPEEAVTAEKQRNICRTALYYLYKTRRGTQVPMRFDVISVTDRGIRWIRDAFPFVQ